MSTVYGSNLFTDVNSTLAIALTDQDGLAVLARCLGAAPTTANVFQHGCLILRVDSGNGVGAMYQNTGTPASPSWTLVPLSGGGGIPALTNGHIFVGNGSNVATDVAVTGDVTISNAGVTAIAANSILDADINTNAAIATSKLQGASSGSIVVADVSNFLQPVAMTGDVTISPTGVTTVANSAVTKAKLASGVRPEFITIAAGSYSTTGGGTTETIANASIALTDIAFVQMYQAGGTPVSVVSASAIAGGISVTFSGDPSNDHVLRYHAIRATT